MSKITLGLSILTLALFAGAGAVRAETADAPVATAADTAPIPNGPIANDRADDTAAQISDWVKEASQAPTDDLGEPGVTRPLDRGIHGEMGASIGTGGYRNAYGVVNIPIGRNGSATVAASDTRYRTRWGGRGGGQSLSLALDFSNAGGANADEDRCRTAANGRYVDPVWVARARRGEVSCGGRPYYAP